MANKITLKFIPSKDIVVEGKNIFLIKSGKLFTFYEWKNWLPNKKYEYHQLTMEFLQEIIYE